MQQWAKINKEMTKIEEHDERQKEKDKDGMTQITRKQLQKGKTMENKIKQTDIIRAGRKEMIKVNFERTKKDKICLQKEQDGRTG